MKKRVLVMILAAATLLSVSGCGIDFVVADKHFGLNMGGDSGSEDGESQGTTQAEEPAVEEPVEEQPVEEQPVEEQPVEEQPVEEMPMELSPFPFSFQASVNGTIITFPCTKEAFEPTGLAWDPDYVDIDLATGYTTSGGRIGDNPGGIVVTVVNNTGETRKVPDCVIDDACFYMGGTEDFVFPGGITRTSTIDDVNGYWAGLGIPASAAYNEGSMYTVVYHYLNPDDPYNTKNKIKYTFFDGVLDSVYICTDGVIRDGV